MIAIACIAISARFMKTLDFAVIQSCNSMFGVCFTGALLLGELMSKERVPFVYDNFSTYFVTITGGMINSLSQNLMILTMQNANPATVSLFRYTGVVYSFIWDLIFFKRTFDFL